MCYKLRKGEKGTKFHEEMLFQEKTVVGLLQLLLHIRARLNHHRKLLQQKSRSLYGLQEKLTVGDLRRLPVLTSVYVHTGVRGHTCTPATLIPFAIGPAGVESYILIAVSEIHAESGPAMETYSAITVADIERVAVCSSDIFRLARGKTNYTAGAAVTGVAVKA